MKKIYSVLFFLTLSFYTLHAQNEFYNDGGDVTVENGGLLYVDGEFFHATGGTFTNNGEVQVKGDYTSNGTFTHSGSGTRLVRINGTSGVNQNIGGTNARFYNLRIENDRLFLAGVWTGGGVLQNNVQIDGQLDLNSSNAKIALNGNEVYLASGSSVIGYGNLKYLQTNGTTSGGTLRRHIGGAGSYSFPLGTQNELYTGFTLDVSSSPSTGDITAQFVDYSNPGGVSPQYQEIITTPCPPHNSRWLEVNSMVQGYGYWNINTVAPLSSTGWNYDIEINTNTTPGVATNQGQYDGTDALFGSPYVFYKLLKTNSWSAGHNWFSDIPGSGSVCDGSPTINGLRATGLNSFSTFGVGGNSTTGLPVELLYLRAKGINNEFIKVEWATEVEINNHGFELQRSLDGENFSTIAWIEGNGTTTQQHFYDYDDRDVTHNTVYYYRLKQFDFNGDYEYTYIVSASIIMGDIFTISEFIPNPTDYNTSLIVTSSVDKRLNVTVYNTLGQMVYRNEYMINPGQRKLDFSFEHLASATYHAIITYDNQILNKKLVITKY